MQRLTQAFPDEVLAVNDDKSLEENRDRLTTCDDLLNTLGTILDECAGILQPVSLKKNEKDSNSTLQRTSLDPNSKLQRTSSGSIAGFSEDDDLMADEYDGSVEIALGRKVSSSNSIAASLGTTSRSSSSGSSSSSSSSSSSNNHNIYSVKLPSPHVKVKTVRAILIPDQKQAILSLSQCIIAVQKNKLPELLKAFSNSRSSGGSSVRVVIYPTDFLLQLCVLLAELTPSVHIYHYLTSNRVQWVQLYGILGYCKYLECAYKLTSHESFFRTHLDAKLEEQLLAVVNDIYESVLHPPVALSNKNQNAFEFWLVPVYQLRCLANITKSRFYDTHMKQSYGEFFYALTSNACSSSDVRVRLEIAQFIPTLFPHFAKHKLVYSMLRDQQLDAGCYDGSDDDEHLGKPGDGAIDANGNADWISKVGGVKEPWRIMTVCLSLLKMGLESETIRRNCVIDILRICVIFSRSNKNLRRSSSSSSSTGSSRVFDNVVVRSMLPTLFKFLSRKLGYESHEEFLTDNLAWMLHGWIGK